jgi:hypothetical protein
MLSCLSGVHLHIFIAIIIIVSSILLMRLYGVNADDDVKKFFFKVVLLIILTLILVELNTGPLKYIVTFIWLIVISYLIYPYVERLTINQLVGYLIVFVLLISLLSLASALNPTSYIPLGKYLPYLLLILIILGLFGQFVLNNNYPQASKVYFALVVSLFSGFYLYDNSRLIIDCKTGNPDSLNRAIALILDMVNIFSGGLGLTYTGVNSTWNRLLMVIKRPQGRIYK